MTGWQEVIAFWFEQSTPEDWFGGKAEFDARLAEKFTATHARVALGEAWSWRDNAEGRLAEIIVLDQFSRQLHRGTAKAFASDTMALALAQEAVRGGFDQQLPPVRRSFCYMPYMHSESALVHEEALRLFESLGDEDQLGYERGHREIITRFGRFPMRNAALGRASTLEETAYIAEQQGRAF